MRVSKLYLLVVVMFIIASVIIKCALLGTAPAIKLGSAPSLTGAISQSIDTTGGKIKPPIAGKDYSLKSVRYFNADWAVASISPLTNSVGRGVVVMQKREGIYQVVLGPGTAFDSSYLQSLPANVGQYLTQKGAVYEFTYQ